MRVPVHEIPGEKTVSFVSTASFSRARLDVLPYVRKRYRLCYELAGLERPGGDAPSRERGK
jgi:hypothetical protein